MNIVESLNGWQGDMPDNLKRDLRKAKSLLEDTVEVLTDLCGDDEKMSLSELNAALDEGRKLKARIEADNE